MRAIGYIRVSTEDQARDGLSLAAQVEKIRGYCIAKGWGLLEIIEDQGRSGKDLNRPGIEEIIKRAKHGAFDVLVICKLDRMTRNIRDHHARESHWDNADACDTDGATDWPHKD